MKSDGMPEKLINLIKAYYVNTKAAIRTNGELSSEFSISTGVRQGCVLSPILFNYAIDWIMNNALTGYRGIELGSGKWVSDLEYADDIVVFGDSVENLQPVLDRIQAIARKVGLEINAGKTKYFASCLADNLPELLLGNDVLNKVESFQYLG